ncbi:MAG: DUF1249 domain-containing protein, partial [Phototrophicales bacterium]
MNYRKRYVPDLMKMGAMFERNYLHMQRLLQMSDCPSLTRFDLHVNSRYLGKVQIVRIESAKYTDT